MNSIEVLNVLSRWLHVATAIVVVGGTVFIRFVLSPEAEQLPPAEHDRLRDGIMRRWRKIVGAGIGILLLTGFYNYIVVAVPNRRRDSVYHMLMGSKIALALIVFLIASALVGRAAVFAPIRLQRKRWMGTLVGLALLIVLISSYLKVSRP